MKKSMYLSLALFLLTASGGWAYDFDDTTLVQRWNGNSIYPNDPGWTDVIGDTRVFDTLGANWNSSSGTLSIFTNWNPGKDGQVDGLNVPQIKTADLFIFSNNTTFAIRLDTTGMGSVYINPQASTSQDIIAPIWYLIYGGRFNQGDPSPVPVQGTGTSMGFAPVSWTTGTNGLNEVAVDLSKLGLANEWTFVWGTATCANDTFSGQVGVPEPGSLLLLGLGFIGLGAYGRKAVRK